MSYHPCHTPHGMRSQLINGSSWRGERFGPPAKREEGPSLERPSPEGPSPCRANLSRRLVRQSLGDGGSFSEGGPVAGLLSEGLHVWGQLVPPEPDKVGWTHDFESWAAAHRLLLTANSFLLNSQPHLSAFAHFRGSPPVPVNFRRNQVSSFLFGRHTERNLGVELTAT